MKFIVILPMIAQWALAALCWIYGLKHLRRWKILSGQPNDGVRRWDGHFESEEPFQIPERGEVALYQANVETYRRDQNSSTFYWKGLAKITFWEDLTLRVGVNSYEVDCANCDFEIDPQDQFITPFSKLTESQREFIAAEFPQSISSTSTDKLTRLVECVVLSGKKGFAVGLVNDHVLAAELIGTAGEATAIRLAKNRTIFLLSLAVILSALPIVIAVLALRSN